MSDPAAPNRLARQSALMAVATVVASAANYGTNVWLARTLDLDAFGDAALIVSFLLLLSAVAIAVQLAASHRRTSRDSDGVAGLYSLAWRYAGAAGLVLTALSPVLASLLNSDSVASFAILGLAVPIYITMSIDRGVMQGEQRFTDLGRSLVVEGAVRLIATGAALVILPGATAAAVGMAASFAVTRLDARSRRDENLQLSAPTGAGGDLVIGLPLMLLLFGQVLIANGDVVVVSAVAPVSAGTFAAVALIGRISFPLSWAIINVAFPKLADPLSRDSVIRVTTGLVGGLAVVTAIATWLLGPFAAGVLFGDDAAQVTPWLVPYSVATGAFAIATLGAVIDVSVGRWRGSAWLVVFGGIQTFSVAIVASRGVGAAVWAQVAVMGVAAVVALVNNRAAFRPRTPVVTQPITAYPN